MQNQTVCGICERVISCNLTGTERLCYSCGIDCVFNKVAPDKIINSICGGCSTIKQEFAIRMKEARDG